MKTCYIDAFSGISGDMTVGALLDAGADFQALTAALDSLGTGATFRLEKTKRKGIAASKFYVDGGEQKAHRHLHHIERMIGAAPLSDSVKQMSIAVFRRLGESESRMHATTIEKVHFHEVGAVDSICDIVGACFCLDNLGIDTLVCSPINTGSGTVNTEHGVLPVPAPATADLLIGKPIYARGPAMELTTPTGAALVSTLAKDFGVMPALRIAATGYGAGDRDLAEHANVLRVIVGEPSGATESTTVSVIEANIDDMTGEALGYAMERLLSAGALDVTLTPVYMKKNRPGQTLTVLARPEDREALAQVVLHETSTFGLRVYTAERRVLERTTVEVSTPYGNVGVKTSAEGKFAPEYEDCRRIATACGVAIHLVMAEAEAAYLRNQR